MNEAGGGDFIDCVLYATGGTMRVPVARRIASERTAFQQVDIVDTEPFGRCLVLDGILQTAERDHALYDAALLRALGPADRSLLVVGGGDGYVALAAVAAVPALRVQVVDIDRTVVALSDAHLNPGFTRHPRVALEVADAAAWARAHAGAPFDGAVLDLTDAPLDAASGSDVAALYRRIVGAVAPRVRPGGWLSAQAGAAEVAGDGLRLTELLPELLAPYVVSVQREDVFVPSYGEANVFLWGRVPG